MGGFTLAAVNTLGGLTPILTWGTLAVLAVNKFSSADFALGDRNVNDKSDRVTIIRTRKAVDMGKSMIRELAKAAPITVLFNSVGIGALSL